VVWRAIDPAAIEDSDPLECEGTDGGGVGGASLSFALVVRSRPEGAWNGFPGPFDKGLTEELRGAKAPVDPRLVPAALGDRGDADAPLDGGRVGESFALLPKGRQQSCGEDRSRSGQCAEEPVVGQLVAQTRDLAIEALDGGGGSS